MLCCFRDLGLHPNCPIYQLCVFRHFACLSFLAWKGSYNSCFVVGLLRGAARRQGHAERHSLSAPLGRYLGRVVGHMVLRLSDAPKKNGCQTLSCASASSSAVGVTIPLAQWVFVTMYMALWAAPGTEHKRGGCSPCLLLFITEPHGQHVPGRCKLCAPQRHSLCQGHLEDVPYLNACKWTRWALWLPLGLSV